MRLSDARLRRTLDAHERGGVMETGLLFIVALCRSLLWSRQEVRRLRKAMREAADELRDMECRACDHADYASTCLAGNVRKSLVVLCVALREPTTKREAPGA